MSSLKKCIFRSPAHFFFFFSIGLCVFLVLSGMSCLYILEMNPFAHIINNMMRKSQGLSRVSVIS